MYEEDSFFTLTVPGQVGLAVLSVVMSFIALWICWRLSHRIGLLPRALIALGLFYAFVWLAPQVYYTYYVFLLDGLPWQVVVRQPPSPLHLLNLLLFREQHNLSFHSQGVLGWLLIIVAALSPKFQPLRRK
nr:hypothetical protein [uncultured bacterium]